MADAFLNDLAELGEQACLYASFDRGVDTDFSLGSGKAIVNDEVVRFDPHGGRFGGALIFSARDHEWAEDEFTFSALDNFPYSENCFEGSISLWMRGDPDVDLHPEYPVDPFHISRHPADGSFYLDLTRPNDARYGSPRKLRFGFYGDSPERNMHLGGQMIVVGDLGWNQDQWRHVVAVWRNTNSGQPNGQAELYIDGQLRGSMAGYQHDLTWDLQSLTIGLGQRYVGRIDELLITNKALTAEQVAKLHTLDRPLQTLWR